MTNSETKEISISKITFSITCFLLALLIMTSIGLFGYVVKVGFENRERIAKTEECLISVKDNQKEMLESQKEIMKSLNDLKTQISGIDK